jgi:diguanylate cyclase (GGDEF)-like protein/PAS domain S-box-containing protein
MRHRGYSVEEAMSLTLEQTLTPESLQKVMKVFAESMVIPRGKTVEERRKASLVLDLENYCKDGSIIDVETTFSFLLDLQGEPIGILGSSRDITARKRAEAQVRKFSQAVEQSGSSIVITDVNANIEYANPQFTKVTGYALEEALGKNPRILQSGRHGGEFYKELWQAITTGKTWRGVFHNKRKDGTLYWESAIITPVQDENGKTIHYIAIKEDITERKRAEEDLQQAHEQLSRQLAEIEQLQVELREQAVRDPLTGLYNRRVMDDMFQRELSRSKREGCPLSVIVLDMDNLKIINDTFGHAAGDLAIQTLASHMRDVIRGEDIVIRYGGDEFIVILGKTTVEDALKRVEEWREALNNNPLDEGITVKFTAGIANFPAHGESMESVIKCADAALYRAKAQGRNCSIVFSQAQG